MSRRGLSTTDRPPVIEDGGYGDAKLRPDTRVELHPATERWMRGDRFGTIVHAMLWRGQRRYHVRMDASHDLTVVSPANLRAVQS